MPGEPGARRVLVMSGESSCTSGHLFVGREERSVSGVREASAGEHRFGLVVVRRVPVERTLCDQLLRSRRKPPRAERVHCVAARPACRQFLSAFRAVVGSGGPLLARQARRTA